MPERGWDVKSLTHRITDKLLLFCSDGVEIE